MSLLPIHHTFGPMVTRSQIARALLLQFTPWKWKTGKETGKLQEELQQKYNQDVYLFDCGRMALYSALKTLDIQPGEEIIIQAYTCIVVPNAITAIGGTPVYVDIDPETLNFEYDKIEAAITNRTRAIIAQHTFGIHSDLTRLREICDKHNIALIEDCAHILDNSVAQQGDISIISFGRDKAVSGVTGGAVLTKHELLSHRLKTIEKSALHHTNWQILQWISYPLRYQFAKWIWVSQLGKAYLKLLQKLGWLPPVLTSEEKDGHAKIVPYALPNGCAALALKQLKNLDSINTHRKAIAEIYSQRVDTAVTDITVFHVERWAPESLICST